MNIAIAMQLRYEINVRHKRKAYFSIPSFHLQGKTIVKKSFSSLLRQINLIPQKQKTILLLFHIHYVYGEIYLTRLLLFSVYIYRLNRYSFVLFVAIFSYYRLFFTV